MVYRDAAQLALGNRNLGILCVSIDPSGLPSRRGTSNGTSFFADGVAGTSM